MLVQGLGQGHDGICRDRARSSGLPQLDRAGGQRHRRAGGVAAGLCGPQQLGPGDAAGLGGGGARRLARGAAATAACAASVFCLLVGAGTWLTGAPPPVWFPWRALWIAALLAAGIALVPVWRRLAAAAPGE